MPNPTTEASRGALRGLLVEAQTLRKGSVVEAVARAKDKEKAKEGLDRKVARPRKHVVTDKATTWGVGRRLGGGDGDS